MAVDPGGVKKGTDEASRHLGGIERLATRVGKTLVGMFAAREVYQFGKASVAAFAEAQAGWNRLAATVDATGVSFAAVRPRIEAAADAMMDASRFGDDEFAAALQSLTLQTGNVEKSLGLMGLAADLAAAKQLTLESAAETLGRALAGNTTQLTRMFPALKESTDLFGELQKTVQGMAERDVQGLEGQLVQMNNAWGEFKEAIGEALTDATNGTSVIDLLTGAIKGLTDWITKHKGTIGAFASGLGGLATRLGNVLDRMAEIRRQRFGDDFSASIFAPGGRPVTLPGVSASGQSAPAVVATAAATAAAASALEAAAEAAADAAERMATALEDADLAIRALGGPRLAGGPNASGVPLTQEGRERFLAAQARDRQFERGGGSLTPVTPISPPLKITPDAGPGFLAQTFGALKGQVMGLAASFGPLAAAVAVLNPVFEGLMSALGPTLSALVIPLKNFGFLIGSVITPVLKLLAPVLEIVSMAFAKVIQGIGWLIRGVGDLLNKLPGSIGNPLKKFGQEMIDAANQSRRATSAQVDLTKETEGLASSMSNVPRVLALSLLRFNATGGGSVPGGGVPGGGTKAITITGPVTFNGVGDMDGVIAAVEGHVAKQEWRAGTSRLASALV